MREELENFVKSCTPTELEMLQNYIETIEERNELVKGECNEVYHTSSL